MPPPCQVGATREGSSEGHQRMPVEPLAGKPVLPPSLHLSGVVASTVQYWLNSREWGAMKSMGELLLPFSDQAVTSSAPPGLEREVLLGQESPLLPGSPCIHLIWAAHRSKQTGPRMDLDKEDILGWVGESYRDPQLGRCPLQPGTQDFIQHGVLAVLVHNTEPVLSTWGRKIPGIASTDASLPLVQMPPKAPEAQGIERNPFPPAPKRS